MITMIRQYKDRWMEALTRVLAWVVAQPVALADEAGQSEWVGQIMILGIVLLIAAIVFAFWKAGGGSWVNSQLSSITQY